MSATEPDNDHLLSANLLNVFNERDRDPARRARAIADLFLKGSVMYEPDGIVQEREAISTAARRLLDQFGTRLRLRGRRL